MSVNHLRHFYISGFTAPQDQLELCPVLNTTKTSLKAWYKQDFHPAERVNTDRVSHHRPPFISYLSSTSCISPSSSSSSSFYSYSTTSSPSYFFFLLNKPGLNSTCSCYIFFFPCYVPISRHSLPLRNHGNTVEHNKPWADRPTLLASCAAEVPALTLFWVCVKMVKAVVHKGL